MVPVPAGEFLMGSIYEQVLAWNRKWSSYLMGSGRQSGYAFLDELYQFRLYLDEFEIDKFEVINAHYKLCVEAAVCQPPQDEELYLSEAAADYPVDWVSWEDATAYCEWVGKRLPREAEWEKAARGTDARIYPWGNEWDERRLQLSSGYRKQAPVALSDSNLMPVGSFPAGASPYGALDIVGNVAEWTATTYALYPGTILPKDAHWPVGEPVIRGGRLYYREDPPNMSHLLYRTALRHGVRGFQGSDPDNQEGFRCARGAEPPPLSEAIVSTTAPQPLPTASRADLLEMVLIPAGEFMMGTDEAERPGDVLGNASEWNADWCDKEYYANSPIKNPLGAAKAGPYNDKVVRGGDYSTGLAIREGGLAIGDNGFRCAYSP
jgi:formylglycine-generating enzyme required for sulfatase activity